MVVSKVTEDGHDYVALSWIKTEIVSNLRQAQQILEKLAEVATTLDKEAIHVELSTCYELIHQVYGALQMVGFPGATLFAEEMKLFCEELLRDNVENFDASLQILIQAILQVPPYLEIIQTEGQDIPFALLPLINQMRECYKAHTLSEIELFSPKYYGLSSSLTDEELKEINTEGLTNLLRKLRQSLQLSLIDLIQNRNIEIAIDHLIKIFNYLRRLCKTTVVSKLWQAAQAFVIAINEKSIPNSLDTKLLLKQIDAQIKLLTEKGVAGMNDPAPEHLLKELLFLLSTVESNSTEIQKVKEEFQLTASTLGINEINQRLRFTKMEESSFESVSHVLKFEFGVIKTELKKLARFEEGHKNNLDNLSIAFKKITNTLEVLGLPEQKQVIAKQQETLYLAIDTKPINQEQVLNLIESVSIIENTIINTVNDLPNTRDTINQDAVLKEAAYALVKVKDILSLYFDSKGSEGVITDINALLINAVQKLNSIKQYSAAAVLVHCLEYIEEHFIRHFSYPENKEIESIVGVIASIDYYMECLVKNQLVSAISILGIAEEYLDELNYALTDNSASLVAEYIAAGKLIKNNEISEETLLQNSQQAEFTMPKVDLTVEETPSFDSDDEIIDDELVDIFSEEMAEIHDTLSTYLSVWTANTENIDALKEVRRAFHTVKGSGRMVKAVVIGELGWAIENMLNRVLDHTILASSFVVELVKRVMDVLPELVKEYAEGQQHERKDVNGFIVEANMMATGQEFPKEATENLPDSHTAVDVLIDTEQQAIDDTLQCSLQEKINNVHEELKKDKPARNTQEEFDTELVDIFVAEARVHMQVLKVFLQQCELSLPQHVTDALQRSMHTLKGSSLMANLGIIANIAKPFEGFLKECNINGWAIDKLDFELLKDAYALLNEGVNQLELHSLAPVDGTETLAERIRLRREDLLLQLELNVTSDINNDKDSELSPAKLTANILEQVDLLLDAEEYIAIWQKSGQNIFPELQGLQDELNQILPMALKAGFKPISALSNVLLKAYQAITSNTVELSNLFFDALTKVQQVLLDCIDQLAAAQMISEHLAEIAILEQALTDDRKPHEQAPAEVTTTTTRHHNLIDEDTLVLGAPAPKGPIIDSDHIDADMAEIFLEEADDILSEARKDLDDWIKDQNDDALRGLQRQLHTLKGGARMCGAKGIGDIAHGLEFIYEGLLNGRYSYSIDLAELLKKAHDVLQVDIDTLHNTNILPTNSALLNAIKEFRRDGKAGLGNLPLTATNKPEFIREPENGMESADEPVIDIVTERLPSANAECINEIADEDPAGEEFFELAMPSEEQASNTPVPPIQVVDTSAKKDSERIANVDDIIFKALEVVKPKEIPVREVSKEIAEQVKVSAELLDTLVNLAGETSIYRGRIEQQNSDLATVLFEVEATVDRVRDQLRRLDIETQSQIISRHQVEGNTNYTDFDPLEMDQYSQLQQLSRSLFESATDLFDLKDTLKRRNHDIATLLQQQARINTDLQEGLMHTRMVPLERIGPRLRRLVRQVSSELGKDIDFVIGNTAGEMDRGVIDAMIAPLEHMIRNSLDHGIESHEVRLAANKPGKGTVSLDLTREGGEMVLRLKDDGAGIPVEEVRKKAISSGLMGANEQLSDKEILQFVLEAGFSTAKKITQISGRGVGLDVVVNAVKHLGGALTLDSEEGKGSVFSIRLPINLSVSRALMVRVGEESYAIPMSTIEGVTYISAEQQKEFYQFGTAELEYGNDTYRVKYLGELLSNQSTMQQSVHTVEGRSPVLLVRSGDHYMALRVDELLPSSEIVVKSLGVQFLSVPAISGATILGDGNVIIILDLSALVRSYIAYQHQSKLTEDRRSIQEQVVEPTIIRRPPLVMVVDDSVTVRKVTTRLLERQGMEVITARDGLDAVTQLDERVPDIMLLDIEMPRMDGFEVATRVRHDARIKHLPIIMITSRSGDKHRERALGIGVNEYMSKPFMDAKLIKSISDLLPAFQVNLLENNS